jgi:hypothetical protein
MITRGKRDAGTDPVSGVPDFFPDLFPHRKAEANEWLDEYLRIVVKIAREREELKRRTGSVQGDSIENRSELTAE